MVVIAGYLNYNDKRVEQNYLLNDTLSIDLVPSSNITESTTNKNEKTENIDNKIDFKTMILLSIATSIDALAVGITFAFFRINILLSVFLNIP